MQLKKVMLKNNKIKINPLIKSFKTNKPKKMNNP